MAVCETCGENMRTADGCTDRRAIVDEDGNEHEPIPYGEEERWEFMDDYESPSGDDRCHDCAAKAGELHHPGCDMEECPVCGRQYLGCGCRTNDDEDRLVRKDWYDPEKPAESIAEARRELASDVDDADEFRIEDDME